MPAPNTSILAGKPPHRYSRTSEPRSTRSLEDEPWTGASILQIVDRCAEFRGLTREDFLKKALSVLSLKLFDRDQRALWELAGIDRDAEERERRRQHRQHLAVLPDPEMQERVQRAEAHLDRRYSKLASQLEQLQRMRSGDGMPPPVRLEVTAQ